MIVMKSHNARSFHLLRDSIGLSMSDPSKPRLPPLPAILAVFVMPLVGAYAMYKWSEPTRVEKEKMEMEVARQQKEGKLPVPDDDDDD